tara:strand:- start:777 stop:1352 length:576 start_codon:yes stop_codon:yes gene_type:complete
MNVEGTIKIGEASRWAGKAAARLNGYPWTVIIANLVSAVVALVGIFLIGILQALFHWPVWVWLPLGAVGLYASWRIAMMACRAWALQFARRAFRARGLVDPVPTAYRLEGDAFVSRSGLVETRAPWRAVSDLFLAGPYWVVLAQANPIYLPRRFFADTDAERGFIAAMLDRMSPEAVLRSPEAVALVKPPA